MSEWLPVSGEAVHSANGPEVLTCALCGALSEATEALEPPPRGCWKEIDGEMYCPDCWHICSGKECGHRPEDGERCAHVNAKPRFSIECLTAGFVKCPWRGPSVNDSGERGYACNLPDERGDECPRVQQATKNRESVLRVADHGDERALK